MATSTIFRRNAEDPEARPGVFSILVSCDIGQPWNVGQRVMPFLPGRAGKRDRAEIIVKSVHKFSANFEFGVPQ